MRLFSSSLPSRTTQVEVVEEEKEAFSVFLVAAQAASQVGRPDIYSGFLRFSSEALVLSDSYLAPPTEVRSSLQNSA